MHLLIRDLVTGNCPSPSLGHPLLHTSSNTIIHIQRITIDHKRTSTQSQKSGPLRLPPRLFTFHNCSLLGRRGQFCTLALIGQVVSEEKMFKHCWRRRQRPRQQNCLPLTCGYIYLLNHEKMCIKSKVEGILCKLATNDHSDEAYLLTSKFWP